MAFLASIEKFGPDRVHLHFDDEAGGKFLDLAAAISAGAANAHFYCCGPNPMLKAFEAAAASRPRHQVHVEYFTPKEEAGTAKMGGFWVELARSGEEYFIPEGKKILEVLYEAGVDVDYSCELGICGECVTRVISGIPEHHDFRAQRGRTGIKRDGHDLLRGLQKRASRSGHVDVVLSVWAYVGR